MLSDINVTESFADGISIGSQQSINNLEAEIYTVYQFSTGVQVGRYISTRGNTHSILPRRSALWCEGEKTQETSCLVLIDEKLEMRRTGHGGIVASSSWRLCASEDFSLDATNFMD